MQNIIPFPIAEAGVGGCRFRIERVDFAAPEASGRQGGVQAGWPLWRGEYRLDRMDGPSGDIWQSFFDRLRGRQRLFLGGDVTREFPRAYEAGFAGMMRASGGAFSGAASSWTQAIDSDSEAVIGMDGLPANLALAVGDYIGWKWDAAGLPVGNLQRRAMARVSAAATASSGGTIAVKAEPPMDMRVVPTGAIIHLDRPQCMLRLVPDDSDLGAVGAGGAFEGGTITAMQELRA